MKDHLARELAAVDWSDWDAARLAVLELMEIYCGGASDAAAVISANFYTLAREYATGKVYDGAFVDSGRVPEATRQAVTDFFATDGATRESVTEKLIDRLGYETRRASGECIMRNGQSDKLRPRYARVPSGSDTCPFCLMLASRGFVYHSARLAGQLNHYHNNCDCRIVPGFDGFTEVEGYDPEACYDAWQQSLDKTAEERAERDGTTVAEEKAAIMAGYRRSADSAHKRNGRSSTR